MSIKRTFRQIALGGVFVLVAWLGFYAIDHHDTYILGLCVLITAFGISKFVAHLWEEPE